MDSNDLNRQIAHLGFIQNIISRMGANSFLLRGWSVTLVAAIFALAVKDADKTFIYLAYFPICLFWVLDTFFLYKEKLYRRLYEEVACGHIASDTFTLDTSTLKIVSEKPLAVFFSKTLLPFYLLLIILVIFVMSCLT